MQNRIDVLSVPIDVVTMTEAVDRVLSFVGQEGLHTVATANAEGHDGAGKSKSV